MRGTAQYIYIDVRVTAHLHNHVQAVLIFTAFFEFVTIKSFFWVLSRVFNRKLVVSVWNEPGDYILV